MKTRWFWAARLMLVLCVSLLAFAPLAQPVVSAQSSRWSEPVKISYGDQYSWFPDISADAAGSLHVVYSSGDFEYDTVMYTSSPNGETWSTPNDIEALVQNGGSEATRPALFIDPTGLMHLTFRDTSVFYAQNDTQTGEDAALWVRRAMVSDLGIAYFSRLAQDSHGRLHVVFSQNTFGSDCPICYHLFYRMSDDGGHEWSPRVDITPTIKGMAKPQILVDSLDNLHIVFETGVGGSYGQLTETEPTGVMVMSSFDRGETWTEPLLLNPRINLARNIAIGEDGNGRLLLAWQSLEASRIAYQYSDNHGKSWTVPQYFEGFIGGWTTFNSRLDSYAMATDSSGAVHLVLVGKVDLETTDLSLLHIKWDGKRWLNAEVIASYKGDAPEWPRIAVSNGNELNVVWTLRDAEHIWVADNAQYKIFYARTVTDAPWIEPVEFQPRPAQPTPAAVKTRLAQPQEPLKTPAAARTPVVMVQNEAPVSYSQLDYALIVVGSILPALVVIGLVLLVLRIFRR